MPERRGRRPLSGLASSSWDALRPSRPTVASPPLDLPFVGREKETAYVVKELEAERSVVLTGPFGIGRTALVAYLARQMAGDWLFAFARCDQGPAQVWSTLFAAIFPRAAARPTRRRPHSARSLRYRVSNQPPEDRRHHAIVLDDIARVTAPGLDVARRLRGKYRVIAIVEAFVPEAQQAALCSALWARPPLRLGYLSRAATLEYFEACGHRLGLGWGAGEVSGLARAVAGFPLGMRQAVASELRRRRASPGDLLAGAH